MSYRGPPSCFCEAPMSQENEKPDDERSLTPDQKPTVNGPFDGAIGTDYSPDSVTRRRRHAVYLPRPPVWRSATGERKRSFPILEGYKFPVAVGDSRFHNDYQQELSHPDYHPDIHDVCPTHATLDAPVGQLSEEQVNFEQQLFSDITAAMAEADAQAAEGDESDSERGGPFHSPFSQPSNTQCDWSFTRSSRSSGFSWSSDDNLSTQSLRQRPLRQRNAGLCTRLHSCRDIRLDVGDKWAIQEGSLVVGIDPSYTIFDRHTEHQPDEFEIVNGDFYVVCCLYADLWALCVKMSFDSLTEDDMNRPSRNCSIHLGFLPLCAVTLAVNYSSFGRRCFRPNQLTHPGNGLRVTPPQRSHSLNASKQIRERKVSDLTFSSMVHDSCKTLTLHGINMEYLPLDSTLQGLFADIGGRRDRIQQIGKRMSFRKLWQGTKSPEGPLPDASTPVQSPQRISRSARSSQTADEQHMRWSSSSSKGSQGRRYITRMAPDVLRGRRRGIRGLMLTGSHMLRGHSRGNSAESDPACYYC